MKVIPSLSIPKSHYLYTVGTYQWCTDTSQRFIAPEVKAKGMYLTKAFGRYELWTYRFTSHRSRTTPPEGDYQ